MPAALHQSPHPRALGAPGVLPTPHTNPSMGPRSHSSSNMGISDTQPPQVSRLAQGGVSSSTDIRGTYSPRGTARGLWHGPSCGPSAALRAVLGTGRCDPWGPCASQGSVCQPPGPCASRPSLSTNIAFAEGASGNCSHMEAASAAWLSLTEHCTPSPGRALAHGQEEPRGPAGSEGYRLSHSSWGPASTGDKPCMATPPHSSSSRTPARGFSPQRW